MFLGPPTIRAFIAMCASGDLLSSFATGVIQSRAANSSARRLKSLFPAALFPFCAGVPAIGVGHDSATSCKSAPPAPRASRWLFAPPVSAFAVGHDEDPLAFVRRADFCRCEEASRRREAHVPKFSQHGFKTEADVACDVFEDDPPEAVSELTGNAGDVRPEVAFVVGSFALSCGAERLAGVSGKQGVDGSGEGPGVEGDEVVPDWRGGEVSGAHGGDKGVSRIGFPLDIGAGVEAGHGKTDAHIQSSAA